MINKIKNWLRKENYSYIFPKLCKDCAFSKPEAQATWNNKCFNPIVVSQDSLALAWNNIEGGPTGVNCREERGSNSKPCGVKGKLWKPKLNV